MIRVIDLETTGIPPEADVVEAAYVDIDEKTGETLAEWSSLVVPTRKISVEARAAHHITDEEIWHDGIAWDSAQGILLSSEIWPIEAFAAHNADFEMAIFNPPGSRWIDTYKCSLRLWPDAPRHTNQVLRYFLPGCDPGAAGMPPHRALPDCHVTAGILLRCCDMEKIEQLITWSAEPPLLPRVPMGKHRGKPWSEVPTDYLEWATRQDFEPGVAHTVNVELKRRSG